MSETCAPVEEDVKLLKRMEEESVARVYLGSVKMEGAFKDIYLVLMPDRSTHIVEVRRLCIKEETAEQG
ncbi:MAG: hypothetical protein QXH21_08975 [Ignisphaera sp.]